MYFFQNWFNKPETPYMHQLVIDNRVNALRSALEAGCDRAIVNKEGLTISQLAKVLCRKECLDLLGERREVRIPAKLKDAKTMRSLSVGEYCDIFSANYLNNITCETSKTLYKVQAWCKQKSTAAFRTMNAKWRNTYYAKEVETGYIANVYIGWVNQNVGYGIFAGENLAKGDYIGEYTGIIKQRSRSWFIDNCYLWEYSTPLIARSPFVIDAKHHGNLLRFVNHSDEPNLKPLYIYNSTLLHVCFKTMRDIPKGQQLCYSYGPCYWKRKKQTKELL